MKAKCSFLVVIAVAMTACSTDDPRYKDIRSLERPPTLAITKQPGDVRLSDDGALDREPSKKGLGEVVYLTDATPHQLKIKQTLDKAWDALGRALKQSDIEVTDHEQDKGLYYIAYKPGGFFSKLTAGSMKGHSDANYTLTLEQDGDEIVVTPAAIGSAAANQEAEEAADTLEALLQTLYSTLHDDLKPD